MLICELTQQIVPVKTLKKTTEAKPFRSYHIPLEKQIKYIFILTLVSYFYTFSSHQSFYKRKF